MAKFTPPSGNANSNPKGENPDDIGGIKKLSEKLYGRSVPKETNERRHRLAETYKDVAVGWGVPTQKLAKLRVGYGQKTPSVLIGVFLFSLIFFVFAFGLAAYLFFSGGNVVSNDRIDIKISGPVAVPAGEELSLAVEIVNRNSATLVAADFEVEYPEGTRSPADRKTEQKRTLETLGDIKPGQRVKLTERAVLFGEENSVKDIKVSVQYQVEGSNAIFTKEVVYHVTLSSAPVVLIIKAPPEMVSGQEAEIAVDVVSNATAPLRGVMLTAEYPFGFEPLSADPAPTIDKNIWFIGDLKPGDQKSITIRGKLVAQNEEERAFQFRIGSQNPEKEREFSAIFSELVKSIVVKRPFIATKFLVENSEKSPAVAQRGKAMTGVIEWTNTLPGKILDIEVEVKFSGNAFDRKSPRGSSAVYRSTDHVLYWNKNTSGRLASLEPGKTLEVTFDFESTDLAANQSLENPNVVLDVVVRATRLREADEAPETVSTTISREVRIESNVFVSALASRTTGPFTNTGPFPPRADQESTYTITWSIQNSASDLGNTSVTGRLPSNVRFVGAISPGGEKVAFNPDNRIVKWDVGNVPHATGYASGPREVAFQVALLPNVKQIGAELPLIWEQSIVGTDRYTGTRLTSPARDLTTTIRNDPGAQDDAYYRVAP